MELIDFMDTDNSSLSDLGDSAASSTVRGLAKFLEKNDNSFLKGLGKTLGKITNIYNVVKITEIVFDKNEDNYKATEIQIILQKRVQVHHAFIMLLIRMVILKKCIQDMPVMLLKMIIILR